MKREKMTTERAREFCKLAQQATVKNGLFKYKDFDIKSASQLIAASMNKEYVVRLRRGVYRWVGPEEITELVGESVYRAYLAYQAERELNRVSGSAENESKSNGEMKSESSAPVTLREQVETLSIDVAELKSQVQRLCEIIG